MEIIFCENCGHMANADPWYLSEIWPQTTNKMRYLCSNQQCGSIWYVGYKTEIVEHTGKLTYEELDIPHIKTTNSTEKEKDVKTG